MGLREIKIALIAAYLLCDHQTVAERFASLGISASLVVYLVLYAGLAAALLLAAQIRNAPVRIGVALLLAAASVMQQSFEWTTNGPLTYEAFLNMANSRGQVGEALAQYGAVLLRVVPIALLLLLGIALPPRKAPVPARVALAAPFAALLLLSAMFYVRGGEGSRALPAAFAPLSFAGLMVVEDMVTDHGPRQKVSILRGKAPVGRDIVLLVDESIVANYLDIDNPHGVPTGLSVPHPGVRMVNYGYAASIHTCSLNSNLGLRYGGTRANYQDTIARLPSIWAYAHAAGLRTVYIDAQSTGGRLQNLMSADERREVDDFIQFDDVPVRERDMAIARVLAEHINNGRREFIYVNKLGAHFPVQDKYPDALMRYRPAMARGQALDLSWSSDRTGFNGTPPEWVRYRNSYRNTLLYNVGEFFHRLLATADLEKATIVYTSDHGQDLHERGNPGNNTHCGSGRPLQEEGLVPLVVFEGDKSRTLDWNRDLAANKDGMSHFRIFPTLLALMGYDRAATRPVYGAPLDDPAKDDFSFNLVFNTRLGRKPEWETIDKATIVTPPDSDFRAR
ncbi:sulfatase-like hydrolase/transferase [Novosphingobium resinovorum]|uniref:sulfatase-like hydrolase/transferase n=1 Tax=Novosphingobium resinovorum TaxID=158500 RepID=UPI002ED1D650|nr:sulfatase-like hydrolase/transferase [Novosphingobium resinovorum]